MGTGVMGAGRRLVGRTDELQICRRELAAARDGAGSLVVVTGDAGIGKSAFCAEVAAIAALDGMAVVEGTCWPDAGAPPLWPWPVLLADRCGPAVASLLDREDHGSAVAPERFSRFAAIADHLAAACAEQATIVVIDDVHSADPEALLLLRFLHRRLRRAPLALLLAGRPDARDSAAAPGLQQLLDDATVLRLGGLDGAGVDALIRASGSADHDPGLVGPLLGLTGGNPLHVRRVLALARTGEALGTLPAGLRGAMAQAVAAMPRASRHILQVAAVLGMSPGVRDVAAVADVPAGAVLTTVAEGVKAGLVDPPDGEALHLTHELVRDVLIEGLAPHAQLDVHARAAGVIAGGGASTDRLARRAHHALQAAPRSAADARAAVPACRAASAALVRGLAYAQAAAVLDDAAAALDDAGEAVPAVLAVERAEVALLCGRLGRARALAEHAVQRATEEDDVDLLARAALGLCGVWVGQQRGARDHARAMAHLRDALDRLHAAEGTDPVGRAALICRLRVRLAAEAAYPGGATDALEVEVAAARRLGDPAVLAEALSLLHHVWLVPAQLPRRLAVAEELIGVAAEAGAEVLALLGLCWRAVDLFQLLDPTAGRALVELRDRADALGCRSLLYVAAVMEVMVLLRAGDLDDVERRAHECHALGVEVGDADALGYLGAHLIALRWVQGREDELLGVVEGIATSPDVLAADFSLRASAAMVAVRAGAPDRARSLLADVVGTADAAGDALAALPPSSTWLAGLFGVVEVAAALDDPGLAAGARRLLQPYADQPVMPSLAVVCLGSVERALGIAALTSGDVDAAVGHLERALVATRRMGNRPVTAITRADLAGALVRRDLPGDRTTAIDRYAEAIDEAEAMGMGPRAAAWAHARSALLGRAGSAGPAAPAPAALVREGAVWCLTTAAGVIVLSDRVGVSHLARLLASPGTPVPALELTGSSADIEPVAQPVLDATARRAYRDRLAQLSAEIDRADADADLARAEQLRLEHDAVLTQIEQATGLGGRDRQFGAPGERARTAVRKALVRVVEEIGAADAELGAHLRDAVRTGRECCYDPGPAAPYSWTVRVG